MSSEPVRRAARGGSRGNSLIPALLLLLAAVVWGFAFVFQSVGSDFVGPFTFLAVRCWIAIAFLIPVSLFLYRKTTGEGSAVREVISGQRAYLAGGVLCGLALFSASAAQQAGIASTTTAKAGFITALYVIFVPVISTLLGKVPGLRIWASVLIGTAGLYLLCMAGAGGGLVRGDIFMIACALLFSVQILLVNHFVKVTDPILLSLFQTMAEGIFATFAMLAFEKPAPGALRAALPALLYTGVLSSGVGYTLQIMGQGGLDPTIASLIMCLESVFSAVGGWLILGETLTARELVGCGLMFFAIVFSQIPVKAPGARGTEGEKEKNG